MEKQNEEILKSISKVPKTIAIMLDLDGTCDFIDEEKAKTFISQVEWLREKFEADEATISISTHYTDSVEMRNVLNILSSNLSDGIKIGLSFYFGGIYDYNENRDYLKEYGFNRDKVATFDHYYVNEKSVDNQWFAIIDDGISDEIYKRYQNKHPMLVCRPTQYDKSDLSKNNFMNIATTTKGIDGVIESLNLYINSIKNLSLKEILEVQKNMIVHLSTWHLIEKAIASDYDFLEKYFKAEVADEDDYLGVLEYLSLSVSRMKSREEVMYLREIFILMYQHFREVNDQENMYKIIKLQKGLE